MCLFWFSGIRVRASASPRRALNAPSLPSAPDVPKDPRAGRPNAPNAHPLRAHNHVDRDMPRAYTLNH